MIYTFNDIQITYYLSEGNCCIVDSYKISSKSYMLSFIDFLLMDQKFAARTAKSYLREWQAHNLLYKLGLFKERTKDVDLNINESWFRRVGYTIISLFYKSSK